MRKLATIEVTLLAEDVYIDLFNFAEYLENRALKK